MLEFMNWHELELHITKRGRVRLQDNWALVNYYGISLSQVVSDMFVYFWYHNPVLSSFMTYNWLFNIVFLNMLFSVECCVDHCLSFLFLSCPLYCVCPSSIDGFCYHFDIFKLFLVLSSIKNDEITLIFLIGENTLILIKLVNIWKKNRLKRLVKALFYPSIKTYIFY